jgi:hypothetical protein
MTRDEFERALRILEIAAAGDAGWNAAGIQTESLAITYRDRLLAAYDALAARIAELEAMVEHLRTALAVAMGTLTPEALEVRWQQSAEDAL